MFTVFALVALCTCSVIRFYSFFFFNDTATTEIYTLSLHDALPISVPDRHQLRDPGLRLLLEEADRVGDRKSTRLNSSHVRMSYAVFCLKNKKNQAVATSQEAVQNQNETQLRDTNAHNDKSVHGVLNPTYQAGLRRDAVQPDIEAERKKRDEIEAGKSYCSRRFGGATWDEKSAQIYARFDKNDWRSQPAEFYRFHDAEVNTFGYF